MRPGEIWRSNRKFNKQVIRNSKSKYSDFMKEMLDNERVRITRIDEFENVYFVDLSEVGEDGGDGEELSIHRETFIVMYEKESDG